MAKYNLNFVPGVVPPIVVAVSQNDVTIRRFEFEMYSGEERVVLDGTQTVEFVQSNGATHAATITDGNVFVDTFADMTSVAGDYRAKLKFTETGGGVIYSAALILKVEGL